MGLAQGVLPTCSGQASAKLLPAAPCSDALTLCPRPRLWPFSPPSSPLAQGGGSERVLGTQEPAPTVTTFLHQDSPALPLLTVLLGKCHFCKTQASARECWEESVFS